MKRSGHYLTKQTIINTNQTRIIQGNIAIIAAFHRGTETVVWNRCSYQVPDMVETNDSTKEQHNFYNSMVQEISIGGGDCDKKVVALCTRFFHGTPDRKTRVENGLDHIFYFWGQKIDVYDQAVLYLQIWVFKMKKERKST